MSLSASSSVIVRLPLSAMLAASALLAFAPSALSASAANAQDGPASSAKDLTSLEKSVSDFIHYVLIGKADLAESSAQAALSADATDADLAQVVDGAGLAERLDKAISRSRSMGGVADLAAQLESRVEGGRQSMARDPKRIAESIGMLRGTLRERMIADERLMAAGEYAVPQLLKVVVDSTDSALELEATKRIVGLKRQAVLPLSLALVNLDANSQRKVVAMLADIGWPTAIPFILEVGASPSSPESLREACNAAFAQLNGSAKDVSAQFTALARRFFDRDDSLIPNPTDTLNNVWSYDASEGGFAGLQATAVSTAIFCDDMAKLLARRALAADPSNTSALAVFIAADLRRENTLGSDADRGRYSPQFFATTAGPSVCNEVLALAIDSKDTALVRDAIDVLAQTAGGAKLVAASGRAPILEALRYSDRRVRLDAALAIAGSNPGQSFPGDFTVVPTLASAVSGVDSSRAVVVGGSIEERQAIEQQLGSAGFASIGGAAAASGFEALELEVIRANGVDLVVLRGSLDTIQEGVARVRASGATAATPIVAIAAAADGASVRSAFAGNRSVVVWTDGGTSDSFRGAAALAISRTSGEAFDEAEGAEYAMRAAEALRAVAVGRNPVFDLADAEPALLRALSTRQGGLRMMVAEVLALIGSPAAQSALVDAAISATGGEQIALCDFAALAARRSGASADERQLAALRGVIANSEGEVADAAGRLYGSLDAGSAEAVKLITRD